MVIVINIIANILVMFLDTFDNLIGYKGLFHFVEIFTTVFFCVEYILRIWTADYLYPESGKLKARLRFLVSYDGIVDLFTILPVFFLAGFVVFRMLRVVRIFHLFRLNSKYDSFNVITSVIYEKRNQIMSSLFILIVLMLGSSLCMYSVEHEAQPEAYANAFSGVWWAVSALLTVGYGDIYPITTLGRIIAIIIAFLGVGVVAIPTGIISAGFVEQYQRKSELAKYQRTEVTELEELVVDETMAGKAVFELNKHDNMEILLILRDDLSILPKEDTMVRFHDVLVVRVF